MENRTNGQFDRGFVPTKIVAVKSERLSSVCLAVFFMMLFLFSLEFLEKNYLWMYLAFIFFIITTRYVRFSWDVLPLVMLSVSMLIFYVGDINIKEAMRICSFPLCYFIGSNLLVEKDNRRWSLGKQEKVVKRSIYVFAFGSFLHYLLNFFYNIGSGTDRNALDIWSGAVRSATNQAILGLLVIGVAIALIFSNRGFWKKALSIVMLIFVISYALTLAGRTIFVILLACGVVGIIHMWIKNPNRTKSFWICCFIFLVILVALALFTFNIFGVRDLITSSNFYERFFKDTETGLKGTNRWEQKGYYIEHFFDNIFGGLHSYNAIGASAHDILLDAHDEYGIFAFASLIVFLGMSLYRTIKFIKDDTFSFGTRQLVLCVSIAFWLVFFLEPVLRGMTWLFCAFCFMQGAIKNAQKNVKKHMLNGEIYQNSIRR